MSTLSQEIAFRTWGHVFKFTKNYSESEATCSNLQKIIQIYQNIIQNLRPHVQTYTKLFRTWGQLFKLTKKYLKPEAKCSNLHKIIHNLRPRVQIYKKIFRTWDQVFKFTNKLFRTWGLRPHVQTYQKLFRTWGNVFKFTQNYSELEATYSNLQKKIFRTCQGRWYPS